MPDASIWDALKPLTRWRIVVPKGVRSTDPEADALRRAFERHMAAAGHAVLVADHGSGIWSADGTPVCTACCSREFIAVYNRAAAAACAEVGVPRRRLFCRVWGHCDGCPNA